MRHLELKDIAGHFPNGLKWHRKSKKSDNYDVVICRLINLEYYLSSESLAFTHKPILRPLDLTKPIVHKGKKIVPIERLKDMFFHKFNIPNSEWIVINSVLEILQQDLPNTLKWFKLQHLSSWVIKKLQEWMFDTDDLIASNLAISTEDLDTNPYE